MCKVASIAKVKDSNRTESWIFMMLLGELMSPGNNDGLGYAAFDKDGNIFGEKWLVNETAFRDLTQIRNITPEKLALIHSTFGERIAREEAQAIILHTRAATCGKGIKNTHPFMDNEKTPKVAIIHNGIIYNDSAFKKKFSTCDSEVIAHLYHDHDVYSSLENLNKFSFQMQGWLTVLALAKDDKGRMVMDAFSDNGRLSSYFIKELDTRVYSSNGDDILRIAKELGYTAVDVERMQADTAFRIDVLTGEQIEFCKMKAAPPIKSYTRSNVEGYSNVISMEGNLSDEEFQNRWFGGGFHDH